MKLSPSIDAIQPFRSLAQFTEQHAFQDNPGKMAFFHELQQCFSTYAYKDITLQLSESMAERLHRIDLPTLFSVIKPDLLANRDYQFLQLLAVISKVACCSLPKIGHLGIIQIWVVDPESSDTPLYWGWISRSIAETSATLMQQVTAEGIIRLNDVSPLVLWTLQRFQESNNPYYASLKVDIPEACISATIQFFDQWGMEQVKTTFENWISFDNKGSERVEESPFDEFNPYGSLKRFIGRCTTLPSDARHDFMRAFSSYISLQAYEKQTFEIPEGYKSRFVKVDLPLLLILSPPPTLNDEQRLIAAIQQVSKLQFTSLFTIKIRFGLDPLECLTRLLCTAKPEWTTREAIPFEAIEVEETLEVFLNQGVRFDAPSLVKLLQKAEILNIPPLIKMVKGLIYSAKNEISTSLCNYYDIPCVRTMLEENGIILTPSQNCDDDELLLRIFVHNLSVEPKTSMKDMFQQTFKERRISKAFLKTLWNEINLPRKQELLDIYVRLAHLKVNSPLPLELLQHFCSHLALGIICYIPHQAKTFYAFLNDPEVAKVFIHLELLQKMIEAFPDIYSELVCKDELEKWRKGEDRRFSKFLGDYKHLAEKKLSVLLFDIETHLHKCLNHLQTTEEMVKGFAQIFYREQIFGDRVQSVIQLVEFCESAEWLFNNNCPKSLKDAFNYLLKQLTQFLEFAAQEQKYIKLLEPYAIEDPAPQIRFMNILWKAKCLVSDKTYEGLAYSWEKPIPLSIQVEWLYIIDQLKDELEIDLTFAAQILTQSVLNVEQTENPELILALFQLCKKEDDSQFTNILKRFRTFEQLNDQDFFSALKTQFQDEQTFTNYLNRPDVEKLIGSHADLAHFKERALKALEPAPLTLSALFYSKLPSWGT